MKKTAVFLSLMSICLIGQAQLAINFDKLTHDFGRIDKSEGEKTAVFNFKNTGNTPIRIISVRPSCGCTTSDFTKDTIFVGESGFVNAVFDPNKSMMGDFSKLVELNTNIGTYKLTIQGSVYNSQEVARPTQQLSYSKTYIKLGEVFFGSTITDTIIVTNHTDAEQRLMKVTSSTGNVTVTYNKERISPKSTAEIYVTLVINDDRFYGETQTGFTLLTSDHFNPMVSFTYDHYIKQKFPKLTKKYLKNAPKLKLDKKEVDYGYVKPGSLHKTSFKITNKGKDSLKILRVYSGCSCLSFEMEENVVAPGESTYIHTSFDTVLRKNGENTKYLRVITNDPKNSVIGIKHYYILIP